MPEILADQTIRFASAAEFIQEYRTNISKNGILARSEVDFPLRTPLDFTLEVPGAEERIQLSAEVVFAAGGQLGLQLNPSAETWHTLSDLLASLVSAATAAATAPAAPPPSEPPPAEAPASHAMYAAPEESGRRRRQETVLVSPQNLSDSQPDLPRRATHDTLPLGAPAVASGRQGVSIKGTVIKPGGASEFLDAQPLPVDPKKLTEVTVFKLVASVVRARLPLELQFTLDGKKHRLHFNIKGNLVRYLAPGAKKDLLLRLAQLGKLPRDKVSAVLEACGGEEGEMSAEEYLIRQRMATAGDAWMAIRGQAIDVLRRARSGERTPFCLRSANVTRRSGVPFGSLFPHWMDYALRDLPVDAVDELLAPLWMTHPELLDSGPWKLSELELDNRAYTFLEKTCRGKDTLRHVRKTSPLGRNATKRLFITLKALGMVELHPDPVLVERGASATAVLERELAWRRNQSRFDQLGVHWSHHPATYDAALEQVREEFGPGSKWIRFHPETRQVCAKIIALAEEAHRFLRNANQRRNHRAELVTEFQMEAGAHLLAKQAELMMLRKEIAEARRTMEVTLELHNRPEYREMLNKLRRMI